MDLGLFSSAELEDIQLYNLDGYLSTVEDLVQADPASIVSLRLVSVIWRSLLRFSARDSISAPSSNSSIIVLSSLTLGASLVPVMFVMIRVMLSRRHILDDVPLAEVKVEDGKFEDAAETKDEDPEVKQQEVRGRGRGSICP